MKRLIQVAVWSLLLTASIAALAAERPIDVAHSTIRIHVGKAGLFSVAGHEHWVTAPIAEGNLEATPPARISFRVEAKALKVEEDKSVSAEQQAEIQNTMQTQVLESEKYPEITFRSASIQQTGENTWEVRGDLTLHGRARPVATTVEKKQDGYAGRCQFKQTDFDIHLVRVAGGMVKVRDQLDIEFFVVPRETNTK